MRRFILAGLTAAALGVSGLANANAAPILFDPGLNAAARAGVIDVQFNFNGRGAARGPVAPRGRAIYRGGNRGGYRGGGVGVGAGIAGLAAGALIGGAILNSQRGGYYDDGYYAPQGMITDDGVAYCMQRYKSYDPASGTYLGYDGYRHPCP